MEDGTPQQALQVLGANVKRLRAAANLTQQQLADTVGVTQSAISRLEKGHTDFTVGLVVSIAEVLGEPVDMLFRAEKTGDASSRSLQTVA